MQVDEVSDKQSSTDAHKTGLLFLNGLRGMNEDDDSAISRMTKECALMSSLIPKSMSNECLASVRAS